MSSQTLSSIRSISAVVLTLCLACSCWMQNCRAAEVTISDGQQQANGIVVYTIDCPHQRTPNRLQVLIPRKTPANDGFRLLLILPVEPGSGTYWGDSMQEVLRDQLHERHRLVCVAPEFSDLPWYADHPTNPRLRQERYLLDVVLPFIERTMPVTGRPQDRLLVGFSKSGWGAFSLLLRHPDVFGRAAAWDAPLMMEKSGQYGSGPIFGTQKNFESYRIDELVKSRHKQLGPQPRLIHMGYDNFREHHVRFEQLLSGLNIPHVYVDGPKCQHAWNSGWLPKAVNLLVND